MEPKIFDPLKQYTNKISKKCNIIWLAKNIQKRNHHQERQEAKEKKRNEKGPDFDFERTHLHIVHSIRHLGIVQYLIQTGDNIEARVQWTPFHFVCVNGHLSIVQYVNGTCKIFKKKGHYYYLFECPKFHSVE